MTDIELKKYALVGLLLSIETEQKKLKKTTDEIRRTHIQNKIDTMKQQYDTLVIEVKQNHSV